MAPLSSIPLSHCGWVNIYPERGTWNLNHRGLELMPLTPINSLMTHENKPQFLGLLKTKQNPQNCLGLGTGRSLGKKVAAILLLGRGCVVEAGRGLNRRERWRDTTRLFGFLKPCGGCYTEPSRPQVLAQGKGSPGWQSCAICEPGTGVAAHSELQEAEGPGMPPPIPLGLAFVELGTKKVLQLACLLCCCHQRRPKLSLTLIDWKFLTLPCLRLLMQEAPADWIPWS